jgi:putative two-component system response regulator
MTAAELIDLLDDEISIQDQDDDAPLFRSEAPCLPVETVLRGRSPQEMLSNPKIMIVDDEPVNIKVARKYLSMEGYQDFLTTSEPGEAVELIEQHQPDLVLLDIMMPEVSGLDILEALRNDHRFTDLPVIILTAAGDRDTRQKALTLGATDFLVKPVEPVDLLPRVRNTLMVKAYHDNIKRYAWELELEVSLRTAQLHTAQEEIIHCLARAAEFRDDETGNHVVRVGGYAAAIGRALGLDRSRNDLLAQAATLHDIGKIGVPDSILLKPGKLDADEFAEMQKHCQFGHDVVGTAGEQQIALLKRHTNVGARILKEGVSPILRMAARIALTHHERWDGSGYPLGLKGEKIPLEGRITAVADVFDALSTQRPYKPAYPLEKCFEMMEAGRGTQFDPTVLDAFMVARREILAVRERHADSQHRAADPHDVVDLG